MKRSREEIYDGEDLITRDMILQLLSALQEFTHISMYSLQ